MIFGDSAIPVGDPVRAGTDRALAHIAAPGTWLTAAERVTLAATARAAMLDDFVPSDAVDESLGEAAQAVAVAADEITPEWIDDLAQRGVDGLTMVELIGVVARTSAIDTMARAVGASLPEFPVPQAGEPSRRVSETVAKTVAWLPTEEGHVYAPTSLSAVPAEMEAMEDLHSAYYLAPARMGERDVEIDGLHRTQMELAASRTSLLNNCFY